MTTALCHCCKHQRKDAGLTYLIQKTKVTENESDRDVNFILLLLDSNQDKSDSDKDSDFNNNHIPMLITERGSW
jgi:hypothetical protein